MKAESSGEINSSIQYENPLHSSIRHIIADLHISCEMYIAVQTALIDGILNECDLMGCFSALLQSLLGRWLTYLAGQVAPGLGLFRRSEPDLIRRADFLCPFTVRVMIPVAIDAAHVF